MFEKINIKDFVTLPFKIYVSTLVALGLLLFLPDKTIEKLYLKSFLDNYGSYVGVMFVLLFSFIIFSVLGKILLLIKSKYSSYKFNRNKEKILKGLSINEKTILYLLYHDDSNTLYLPYNLGIVSKLRSFMIITPTTTSIITDSLNNPKFPFLMQPWVRDYINENKDLYFQEIYNLTDEDQKLLVENMSNYLN